MKRHILLLVAIACSWICAAAQQNPASEPAPSIKYFIDLPAKFLPMLENNTRLDMVDYFQAGSDRYSINSMGGECRIDSIDDLQARISAGAGIYCQIFVLNPGSPKELVGIITSYSLPAEDSKMEILDPNSKGQPYNDITSKAFAEPRLTDWTSDTESAGRNLPFILAKYVYDPATGILTVTNTMDSFFTEKDQAPELKGVNKQLHYKWNGKKFQLQKSDKKQ